MTEQERYAHMMLKMLRVEYEKAAKPYVDILVKAYATKPISVTISELDENAVGAYLKLLGNLK